MAKTRKKNIYRCTTCNKRFGSSPKAAQHFAKYPSHRTDKQRRKHISNMRASAVVRSRAGKTKRRSSVYDSLPTVKRTTGTGSYREILKHCTSCGKRRMPSHNYCGVCGVKL